MRKRQQITVFAKFIADVFYVKGNRMPQVNVSPEDTFQVSENHVFRNPEFIKTHATTDALGELKTKFYGKFMVLRNDRNMIEPGQDLRPDDILEQGVQVNFVRDADGNSLADVYGVESIVYKRALRSASQFRTAKMLMTEENLVAAVRTHASYGWVDRLEGKKMKTVAKVEPYVGLALSSTVEAGTGYTDINIEDFKSEISIKGAVTMQVDTTTGENRLVRYDELVGRDTDEMELTDGASLISPRAMAKACYESGIIFKSDYTNILGGFNQGMTFAEQLEDEVLGAIWAKIPGAIQFRYGLKKGLAVIYDHAYNDLHGNQYDFVFPKGAVKGEVKRFEVTYYDGVQKTIDHKDGVSDDEVVLNIAGISSLKEKKWGMLNYQFIAALNLDFTNDLQKLASKAIKEIMLALKSPENAMAFIGMIDNGDAESFEEQNEAQRIRELLDANPRIFYTKWMQNKIKSLMEKKIKDMAKGRIPLEDARFVYLTADLAALDKTSAPLLKAGEFYYNGQTGERAIFRSPLIHRSEASRITLVTSPELEEAYGHLKNILVVNLFDDTLPRAGGADLDGDKVLLTSEKVIVEAVEKGLPMVYGDAETQQLKEFVWKGDGADKIREYDKNTLEPSEIGKITDYMTSIADRMRSLDTDPEMMEEFDKHLTLGRIQQGKIIDDPKRGTKTTIDSRLVQREFPLWMGKSGRSKVRVSYSPMARLHNWINKTVLPAFKDQFGETIDYRVNIIRDFKEYDPASLQVILPAIANLEASYRQDVKAGLDAMGNDPKQDDFETYDEYKEVMDQRDAQRKEFFEELIERHQLLLSTIDAPSALVGLAAIHVAEHEMRSSKDRVPSYPYVVATDYVIALLAKLPMNYKLVRASNVDGGVWPTSVEVRDNVLYSAFGQEVGTVRDLEDGMYDTHEFRDGYFLKVEKEVESVEVERSEEQVIQFEMKGYKKLANLNDVEAMEMVQANPVTLQDIVNAKGEWLGIIVNGKQIAAVGKETFLNANFAKGRELKVIATQPIAGIIKVTARVIGQEQILTDVPAAIEESYVAEPSEEFMTSDTGYHALFDDTVGM